MYCNKCGNDVANGLTYCDVCGADLSADSFDEVLDVTPATDPGKGLGLTSMIMGIVSLTCCNPFGLLGLAGLILGFIANSKSKASGHKNTFATVGIVLGIITIVFGILSSITLVLLYGTSFIAGIANGSI